MQTFQECQQLDEANWFTCPKCKEKVPSQKDLQFFAGPEILVMTLKRFEGNSKIRTPVHFPLEGLDLERLMPSHEVRPEGVQNVDSFSLGQKRHVIALH